GPADRLPRPSLHPAASGRTSGRAERPALSRPCTPNPSRRDRLLLSTLSKTRDDEASPATPRRRRGNEGEKGVAAQQPSPRRLPTSSVFSKRNGARPARRRSALVLRRERWHNLLRH